MGSYSRKHMIEFANFAKSWQSSKKVEDAYDEYRSGIRIVGKKEVGVLNRIRKANIVYLNGELIKDRKIPVNNLNLSIGTQISSSTITHWNKSSKVLMLKTE